MARLLTLLRSLKTKIIVSAVMIFLLSLWALSYYAGQVLKKELEQLLGEQQLATVSMEAKHLDDEFLLRFQALTALSMVSNDNMLAGAPTIGEVIERRPFLQILFNGGITAFGKDGSTIAESRHLAKVPEINDVDKKAVLTALTTGNMTVGRLWQGNRQEAQHFLLVVPIRDGQAKITGAMSGMIIVNSPNFLTGSITNPYGKSGGYVLISPQDRMIIRGTHQPNNLEILPAPGVNREIDRFVNGFEGSIVMRNSKGIEILSSAKRIPKAAWLIAAALPTQEAFAPIDTMLLHMFSATFALTLVAALLATWVLKRQLAPLKTTVTTLRRIREKRETKTRLLITREDEIGELIDAFNQLLEALDQQADALKKSEQFARAILDSVPAEIAVLDGNGTITMVNQPWLKYSIDNSTVPGKPAQSTIIGANYLGVCQSSAETSVRSADAIRAASGIEDVINGKVARFVLEYTCDSPIQPGWYSMIVTPLQVEGGGVVVSHTDITERKIREKQDRFYSDLMRTISDAVITADADNMITNWNRAAEITYGWSNEEATGRKLHDLLKTEFPEHMERLAQEYLIANKVWKAEICQHRKDGQTIWLLSTVSILEDETGHTIGSVTVNHDISRRKQIENALTLAKVEAEKANRSKSRFLAATSHDMRQPLAALSLYVDLLKQRFTQDNSEIMTNIGYCIDSLTELLTDLLDISKLDAGVIVPTLANFAINDLLNALLSIYSVEAKRKGLHLRLRSSCLWVHSDRMLLHRIVGNLIINAIRYTEKGGVLIACRQHAGKNWIEVWDTGIGIPEDQTEIIFEEFKQLGDGARNRGSGLGLTIVLRMAELMGLQIRLRSKPGRGSMFAIELPGSMEAASIPELPAEVPFKPMRIGVVEDNIQVLRALVLALEAAGHRVTSATYGQQLFEALGAEMPDLIISDYRLAYGETGVDVIKAARELFGEELPAILITGDTDPDLIKNMKKFGVAIHYKPLRLNVLLSLIRKLKKSEFP